MPAAALISFGIVGVQAICLMHRSSTPQLALEFHLTPVVAETVLMAGTMSHTVS